MRMEKWVLAFLSYLSDHGYQTTSSARGDIRMFLEKHRDRNIGTSVPLAFCLEFLLWESATVQFICTKSNKHETENSTCKDSEISSKNIR